MELGGCYFRLRGRTKNQWTLLSFVNADKALDLLKRLLSDGDKVRVLEYTADPMGVPTKRGSIEWFVTDFDFTFGHRSSRTRWNLNKALKDPLVSVLDADNMNHVMDVFDGWKSWAQSRHFMVFTGHYRRWLEMYDEDPGNCELKCYYKDGSPVGIFGWERCGNNTVVTVAKHLPTLSSHTLWLRGLAAIGGGRVLCGSTADHLKQSLGFEAQNSWTFDLRKL